MYRRTLIAVITALGLTGLFNPPSFAQTYPAKPVKSIVPFAPGGVTDMLSRVMAQDLTLELGQAAKRSPLAPELPTLGKMGFPQFEVTSWQGIVAPAGIWWLPGEVTDNSNIRRNRAASRFQESRVTISRRER